MLAREMSVDRSPSRTSASADESFRTDDGLHQRQQSSKTSAASLFEVLHRGSPRALDAATATAVAPVRTVPVGLESVAGAMRTMGYKELGVLAKSAMATYGKHLFGGRIAFSDWRAVLAGLGVVHTELRALQWFKAAIACAPYAPAVLAPGSSKEEFMEPEALQQGLYIVSRVSHPDYIVSRVTCSDIDRERVQHRDCEFRAFVKPWTRQDVLSTPVLRVLVSGHWRSVLDPGRGPCPCPHTLDAASTPTHTPSRCAIPCRPCGTRSSSFVWRARSMSRRWLSQPPPSLPWRRWQMRCLARQQQLLGRPCPVVEAARGGRQLSLLLLPLPLTLLRLTLALVPRARRDPRPLSAQLLQGADQAPAAAAAGAAPSTRLPPRRVLPSRLRNRLAGRPEGSLLPPHRMRAAPRGRLGQGASCSRGPRGPRARQSRLSRAVCWTGPACTRPSTPWEFASQRSRSTRCCGSGRQGREVSTSLPRPPGAGQEAEGRAGLPPCPRPAALWVPRAAL